VHTHEYIHTCKPLRIEDILGILSNRGHLYHVSGVCQSEDNIHKWCLWKLNALYSRAGHIQLTARSNVNFLELAKINESNDINLFTNYSRSAVMTNEFVQIKHTLIIEAPFKQNLKVRLDVFWIYSEISEHHYISYDQNFWSVCSPCQKYLHFHFLRP